jgi:hypothetical protein
MAERERLRRAEARRTRTILRKATLQRREHDPTPLWGPEAVALVAQLTAESWSLSGRELPSYTRDTIPIRFVPGRLT